MLLISSIRFLLVIFVVQLTLLAHPSGADVTQNGAVYAWGRNDAGQLGNGTTTNRHTPIAVSALSSGVTAIAGGRFHSLAVQNGAAYAWGYNHNGQLGDGTTTDRHSPVLVTGLSNGVTAVAGGQDHSLAVQNGAAYA